MAANNIYIQVDFNSATAQQNVNALNQAIAQTGPAAQKTSQQATAGLQSVSVQVQQTSRAFSELTTALAGLGLTRMLSSWIQVSSELERARLAMTAFTGSADEANKVFEQVRAIAAQSPFRFKDLEESARQLLGFGRAAKDVPGDLRVITDQVARMGGSIDNVNGIIRIFGRMVEKDFVGAMDLIRTLPQQGIPVMKALQDQLSRQLKIDVSVADVRDAMKQGILDPLGTWQTMMAAIQKQSAGFGQSLNDPMTAFKRLGDTIVYAQDRLFGPAGFGPALANLAREITNFLAPLGGLIEEFTKLPESTKETIVNIAAFTAGIVAAAGAFALLKTVLSPAIDLIKGLIGFIPALIGLAPELLAAMGALAGIGYILYKTVPQVKDWADTLGTTLKEKLNTLAKEGQDLFAKAFQVPKIQPGDLLNREAQQALFEKLQGEQQKFAAAASKTLLEGLASPVEAVRVKYVDLFAALEEKIKLLAPDMQAALRQTLSGAETAELQAAQLKKTKENIDEAAKYQSERVKGAYDAQIAYIEAMDAQDLRSKVADIDKVTQLRMESAYHVSQVEQNALEQRFETDRRLIEAHRDELAKAGLDADQMIARLREETNTKQAIIDQKAFDDAQKYRLEGWKKANDAIIEDQKRIYQQFQDIFGQIFDAFTDKTKSVGQALSDVFKKLALGEVRQLFSSQLAAFATEAAGYGRPEEALPSRGQGLLGTLLRRGTPPRPPLPPPEEYAATTALSGLVPAGREVGATFQGLIPPAIGASDALAQLTVAAQNATLAMQQQVSGLSAVPMQDASGALGQLTATAQGAAAAMQQQVSGLGAAPPALAVAAPPSQPVLPQLPGAGEMLPRAPAFGSQFLRYLQGGPAAPTTPTQPLTVNVPPPLQVAVPPPLQVAIPPPLQVAIPPPLQVALPELPAAPTAPTATPATQPLLPPVTGAGEMLPRAAAFGAQFLRYAQGGQGGAAFSTLPGSILTGAQGGATLPSILQGGSIVPIPSNPSTPAAPLSELSGLNIKTLAGAIAPTPFQSSVLADIRRRESSDNYRAQNPHTSASGAYQIIDETWRRLTRETGIGTKFRHAKDAPPWMQDINALQLLRTKGANDPGSWGGQPYGAFPEEARMQPELAAQGIAGLLAGSPIPPAPEVSVPGAAPGPAMPAEVSAAAVPLPEIPTPAAVAPPSTSAWQSLLGWLRGAGGAAPTSAVTPGFAGGYPPGLGGGGGLLGIGGTYLSQLRQLFTTPAVAAAVPTAVFGQTPGAESLGRAAAGAGTAQPISLTSILGSQGVAQLGAFGGSLLMAQGLQRRVSPLTVLGGALSGPQLARTLGLSPTDTIFEAAGPLGGVAQGLALGAGIGLFTAGLQRGGGMGLLGTVGGGALAGFSIGGPIGAAIGAAVGAIAGTIRLFVKTKQEQIRASIKQVYGIDISNRNILQQIQQIIDQQYGGSISVGVRSQAVQDIVRLFALSTGQAAMLPRPMYAATIAEAGGGLQLQPVYQGGQLVQNPYTGPTTYQYQTAVTQALGLKTFAGTGQGIPGESGLVSNLWVSLNPSQANNLLTGQVVNIMQSNPSAVASANASAARAGDSRLTTTAAMTSPLTALP